MKLYQYLEAIGLNESEFAHHVARSSGLIIEMRLIHHAEAGTPIAAPKADAILAFLSKEMGRKITLADVSDLKVM